MEDIVEEDSKIANSRIDGSNIPPGHYNGTRIMCFHLKIVGKIYFNSMALYNFVTSRGKESSQDCRDTIH